MHSDDREKVNKAYTEAVKEKSPYEIIHRIVRPSGEIRTVHEKCEHYYDTNGKLISSLGTVHDITDWEKASKKRENLIKELQNALEEIKTLRGILPICSYCKKIRDDTGEWQQIDIYIQRHSEADVSHSICYECLKKYHPEQYKAICSKF